MINEIATCKEHKNLIYQAKKWQNFEKELDKSRIKNGKIMSQNNTNREKNIRSILERSSNINVQTLQNYIDKKLTKEELHEVEKQLLNSDFAAEAAEGFEKADFKVNIAATTNELNREIRKYNKERGFYKTDYRIYYAAASVAFIFVLMFGLMRGLEKNEFTEQDAFDVSVAQQSKEKAEAQKEEETTNSLALNDEEKSFSNTEEKLIEKLEDENTEEVAIEQNSNQNIQSNKKAQNDLAINQNRTTDEKDFSTSDVWITKREKVGNTANSNRVSSSAPIILSDSPFSANDEQLADEDYNFFSEKDHKDKANKSKKSSKEVLFDAMESYDNKNYIAASILFNSYLITNPNDAQALYFGGISYYQNNDYKQATRLLERFLKQKSSSIYQKNSPDAEWFLANSYLKINQKQKAKILLQKIIDSKNKYSSQAKLLLNE